MNILFWGHMESGAVPYFRAGQFAPYWVDLGLSVLYLYKEDFRVDHPALDWADLVVFRRWYITKDDDDRVVAMPTTEEVWDNLVRSGKPVIYDSDDWDVAPSWDHSQRDLLTVDVRRLVEKMARQATLMTASTPYLAGKFSRYNNRVVVVRNAVDLPRYEPDEPPEEGNPTASVYYGFNSRLPEYFGRPNQTGKWEGGYCYAAVKAARLYSIWIGDTGGLVPKEFDLIVPYIEDRSIFQRLLGNLRADIGLAPLRDTEWNRCKSELHWLELSAAGMATVCERLGWDGPYSPVRHGVDGFLAHGRQEWHDAVRRLAREPNLRADIAAAAKERLAADYNPRQRAGEWAAVFREATR